MTFTNDFDSVQELGRRDQRIVRDLDRQERTMRPYQQMLRTHERMLKSFESPLERTMHDVRTMTTTLGGQRSSIVQTVADQFKSFDLAKTWGMSNVAADAARSFSTNSAFQGLAARIIEQQQQPFHGLATRLVEQQLRPLQSLAASVASVGLSQEATRESWRPVLMRSFQAPSFTVMSQIVSAVDAYNGSLAKAVLPNTTSAIDVFRESQTWQARDIIRTLNKAAAPTSALQQLSAIANSYRLRGAWLAPITPDRRIPRHRSPTIQPEPLAAAPPAEAPPTTEEVVEATPIPEEAPQQLTGQWEVLQPVENTLHGITHGPLVVKILAIGVGQLVVMVIGGGLVYFLFYCC